MSPEILAGIIGAAGALLGAGSALAGNFLTGRQQLEQAREQHDAERAKAWRDGQREACLTFITAIGEFRAVSRELADELSKKPDDLSRCDDIYYDQFNALWRAAVVADAAVRVLCPQPVVDAADVVWAPIEKLELASRNWYLAVHDGKTNNQWATFHSANNEVTEPFGAFAQTVQSDLMPAKPELRR